MEKPTPPPTYPVATILSWTPEQQQQYVYAWTDYRVAQQQYQQQKAEKDSKPPSVGEEAAIGLAGPAGVLGGLWALNQFGGSGAPAAAGAATQAAQGAGTAGIASTAATGSVPAAPAWASGSAPAAPNIVSAAQVPQGALTGAQSLSNSTAAGLQAAGVGPQTAGVIGQGIGYGLPIASTALGGYSLAQNLMDNQKDAGGGAMAGAGIGGGMAALGAFGALGPLGILGATALGAGGGGLLGGLIGGNKGKEQMRRDAVRKQLAKAGVTDKMGRTTLADGTQIDIGRDVGGKNQWGLLPFEVDHSQPGIGNLIADVNPLGHIISGGDQKLAEAFSGALTAEANRTGANPKAIYERFGFDKNSAVQAINSLVEAGRLDQRTGAILGHDVNYLFDKGSRYNPGQAKPLGAPSPQTGQPAGFLAGTPNRALDNPKSIALAQGQQQGAPSPNVAQLAVALGGIDKDKKKTSSPLFGYAGRG